MANSCDPAENNCFGITRLVKPTASGGMITSHGSGGHRTASNTLLTSPENAQPFGLFPVGTGEWLDRGPALPSVNTEKGGCCAFQRSARAIACLKASYIERGICKGYA